MRSQEVTASASSAQVAQMPEAISHGAAPGTSQPSAMPSEDQKSTTGWSSAKTTTAMVMWRWKA